MVCISDSKIALLWMTLPVVVLPLAMSIDLIKGKRRRTKGEWVNRTDRHKVILQQLMRPGLHPCHQSSAVNELTVYRYNGNGGKRQELGGERDGSVFEICRSGFA